MSIKPKYTLNYFNMRIRAEIPRLIFAAADQEYTDNRIQEFTEPDYTKLTPENTKFTEDWLAYKPKTPFGQLPTLQVDGVTIAQSLVIARFLGKRFGLAGKTDLEEAKAEMIAHTAEEAFATQVYALLAEMQKEQGKRTEGIEKYETDTMPRFLAGLEKQSSESGHFVGDQLSYADIAFYYNSTLVEYIKVNIDWDKHPKLKKVIENVTSNSGIAKWLEKRPKGFF